MLSANQECPDGFVLHEELFKRAREKRLDGDPYLPPHLWAVAEKRLHVFTFKSKLERADPERARRILQRTLTESGTGRVEQYCFVHLALGYSPPPGAAPDTAYALMQAAELALLDGTFEQFPGVRERVYFSWGTREKFDVWTLEVNRDSQDRIRIDPESAGSLRSPSGPLTNLLDLSDYLERK